jgi:cytochrome c
MIELALRRTSMATLIAAAGLFLSLPAAAQVDEDAAKLLFKKNECSKCHNPDRDKKGPSLKKIAKDNKGNEKKIIEQMTKGAKVKMDDGTEEEHRVIDTKDPKALKNLAQWILSH